MRFHGDPMVIVFAGPLFNLREGIFTPRMSNRGVEYG